MFLRAEYAFFKTYVLFLINQPYVSLKRTVRFITINRVFSTNNTVIYMQMPVLLFVIMHINTVFHCFLALPSFIHKKWKIVESKKKRQYVN